MLIQTKYLNDIEITKEQILSFPSGILGFENHHEFVLLDIPDNDHFKFLQDIKNSYVAFLLINPWDFFKDYDIELPDEEINKLGFDPLDKNQMAIYNIVTIGKIFKESTSNLLAPIVINQIDKKEKHFILNDSPYTTKHKLFYEGLGE